MKKDTLTDFCELVQKSVPFYKTDFFFAHRYGNHKVLLLVQRGLPGMRMVVENYDVVLEASYMKQVPTKKEKNRGWEAQTYYTDRYLAQVFSKLVNVRMATLYDHGFDFICDQGIELYGVDTQYLEDSSVQNINNICGKKFRKPRLNVEEDIIKTWVRPNSDSFFDKIQSQQKKNSSHLSVGQSLKKIDLSEIEI